VDLDGGRIEILKKNGVLILGSFERIDGKKGNTHLCIPNFANDGVEKYGLPFHGIFRNAVWNLAQQTNESLEIDCEVDGFKVKQIFTFDGDFNQKIIIENISDKERPVNAAIHNYWSSDLGWEGVLLNGINMSMGIRNSEFVDLKQTNELNIPGKPLIKWRLFGFSCAKLWTAFLEESGNKIFDNNYFCLEPKMEEDENFFGSVESLLRSKAKLELRQAIGVI
jgi:hypothetical protein